MNLLAESEGNQSERSVFWFWRILGLSECSLKVEWNLQSVIQDSQKRAIVL